MRIVDVIVVVFRYVLFDYDWFADYNNCAKTWQGARVLRFALQVFLALFASQSHDVGFVYLLSFCCQNCLQIAVRYA